MADQFYVSPHGNIIRDPEGSGPDRPVLLPAFRLDLTEAERAAILARAATDPVRIAYEAQVAAGNDSPYINGTGQLTQGGGIQSSVSGAVGKNVALARWHQALGQREYQRAISLRIGTSLTEGANATSAERRWTARLRDTYRAMRGTAQNGTRGGAGYIPAWFRGTTMGNPFSATSGTVNNFSSSGLGMRTSLLSAGASRTYTFTGTSCDVLYARQSGHGQMSVTIDGTLAGTFNCSVSGATTSGNRWSSPALTDGAHTVVLAVASGSFASYNGLIFYRGDEASGVHTYEGARFGAVSADWTSNSHLMWQDMTAVGPHLVSFDIGANDYQAQVDIATFTANVQTVIANVRAACAATRPSVELIAFHRRGDVASPAIPWSSYVNALRNIAAADTGGPAGATGVAFLDLSSILPEPGSAGAGDGLGLIASDRVHYTDAGSAVVAELIAKFELSL